MMNPDIPIWTAAVATAAYLALRSQYQPAIRLKVVYIGPTKFFWSRGTAVERWSLTGELSLPCARPPADGYVHLCG